MWDFVLSFVSRDNRRKTFPQRCVQIMESSDTNMTQIMRVFLPSSSRCPPNLAQCPGHTRGSVQWQVGDMRPPCARTLPCFSLGWSLGVPLRPPNSVDLHAHSHTRVLPACTSGASAAWSAPACLSLGAGFRASGQRVCTEAQTRQSWGCSC